MWDHHLAPLHAVNCGLGGENLPATVAVGVIHCGINIKDASTHAYGPHEIAENVILCGSKLNERHPWISVIIMGILPGAETFRDRIHGLSK